MITKSSVDENIYNLSQRKLKLDAGEWPPSSTRWLAGAFRQGLVGFRLRSSC
jgi:hypothetical protein